MISVWRAGGGPSPYVYAFGYWTGEEKDLICLKKCKTNEESEKYLSPLDENILIAFCKFIYYKYYIKSFI